ncbi:MAG: hypothetical protein EI684_20630 [Candidatus Viridilinea halotolerans]|uniref:DUF11 domain-containing protein n=1 Tax=Candidatus Viridilinea halotolerans TaxID=2491704 RepID=A0A426TRZ5_9CHLR|nr:MAG: hypothetical protein EI684_20630 [Candidatus Viridilinea halotolerans]
MLHRSLFTWSLALLMLFTMVVPPLPAAAQIPAYECNVYSVDPADPFCLLVPVQDATGAPLPGALVTVTFEGFSVSARAQQLVDGPLGQAVALLPLEQIGALPGDHLDIRVQVGNDVVREIIGYRPDPVTRTFMTDPFTLDITAPPAPLFGRVYMLDTETSTPVAGYTLELYRDRPEGEAELLDRFEAGERFDFALDPGDIPLGTRLWLVAERGDYYSLVAFEWRRAPLPMQIALNWPCGGIAPHGSSGKQLPHGSSGKQLPDPFCVIGTVTLNGEALEGVEVSAQLLSPDALDLTPVITQTRFFPQLTMPDPIYLMDIGRLTSQDVLSSTVVRFTARQDDLIGTLELTLADLRIHERWGARVVALELRQEHMPSAGLAGGQPSLVAATGNAERSMLYVGARDGLLLRRSHGMTGWQGLLGSSSTMRGQPELAALAAVRQASGGDLLAAGSLDGTLYLSRDHGNTWDVQTSTVGRVRALAFDPDGTLFVLGSTGFVQRTRADQMTSLPLPPAGTRALAAQAGIRYAGGPLGLFVLADAGTTWNQLRSEEVLALAVDPAGALLVGTRNGLFATNAAGTTWSDHGLTGAVSALARSADALLAITPAGLHQRDATGAWLPVALRDAATPQASLGTPSVYALQTVGAWSYAATQAGVMVSSDGGQNWSPFNPAFTQVTRDIALWPDAPIPHGSSGATLTDPAPPPVSTIMAVGPRGLFAVTQASITAVPLPITSNLNPATIQVSNDGSVLLLGRAGGPGGQLLVRSDADNWAVLDIGANRGISKIQFFPGPRGNTSAIIATHGDGLWLWERSAGLTPFPALASPNGGQLPIGAVWISPDPDPAPCMLVVGTQRVNAATPAATYTRPCDTTSAWVGPQNLVRPAGVAARSVTALIHAPTATDRLFAATDSGFFQGQVGGGWEPIFGLPIRPLALAASANYENDRTLLTGGIQAGVVRLFDATPDLDLRLSCPAQARGATSVACTLTTLNQGLLEADAGSIELTWGNGLQPTALNGNAVATSMPLVINRPPLRTGESISHTISFAVERVIRPGRSEVMAAAAAVPQEIFVLNNEARARLRLDYRDAPDPALVIGGQRMTPLGETGTLQLRLSNSGTQALTSTMRVTLQLPAGVELVEAVGATQPTSGTLEWTIDPLPVAGEAALRMSYRMPTSIPTGTQLLATAALAYDGDDRELANNQDQLELLPTPSAPEVIVLTNMSRLAARGPVAAARSALAAYVGMNGSLELPLDEVPPCADDPAGLRCAYDAWDASVAELTQSIYAKRDEDAIAALAMESVEARMALQAAIAAYVAPQIAALEAAPSYLYIIGDDDVIPYGAAPDLPDADPLAYPQSYYAMSIPWEDPLFSLFKADHYPTDRVYDELGVTTSRQPGGPQEIAAALQRYVAQGGTLMLNAGTVSGVAVQLTERVQQELCTMISARGLALGLGQGRSLACDTIPRSVAAGLPALSSSGRIIQVSDHAARHVIGDATANRIQEHTPGPDVLNLILLLGCHSGVTAGIADEPTLVTTLAHGGQPSFGFLNYAYAGTIAEEGAFAYAERLNLYLMDYLLNEADVTLADGLRRALADYEGMSGSFVHSNRHTKTVNGIALFGPPDYRLSLPRQAAAAAAPQASIATVTAAPQALATPGSVLQLGFSHRRQTTPDGNYYRSSSPGGTSHLLTDAGLPLQPGITIALAPSVGGALIRSGTYEDILGFDPVIFSAAPINSPQRYSERAYAGKSCDRPNILHTFSSGDGNRQLLITTGQWSPTAGTVQRLINTLSVELTAKQSGGQPAAFGGRVTNCRLNQRVRFNIRDGSGIARVEVVLIENGQFSVHPMRKTGPRWTATFEARAWSRYFIQAVGTDGSVTLETNDGNLYIVPDEHAPCGPECDINSALDDLHPTFSANGEVQIMNYSPTCRYEVGLASYAVHGSGLANQSLFDTAKKLLQPNASTTLRVRLPHCATQVDAFYGSAIANPAPPRYADRLLASQQITGGYCSP